MHRFLKWRNFLQIAPNGRAVRALMREYVDAVGMPVIATLPYAVQEVLTNPELDVQAAAVTLLQAELSFRGSEEIEEVLHEVVQTFAAASVRITTLYSKPALAAH